jgi:hypothetical protein
MVPALGEPPAVMLQRPFPVPVLVNEMVTVPPPDAGDVPTDQVKLPVVFCFTLVAVPKEKVRVTVVTVNETSADVAAL